MKLSDIAEIDSAIYRTNPPPQGGGPALQARQQFAAGRPVRPEGARVNRRSRLRGLAACVAAFSLRISKPP
jgi:hypothetical protein